MLRHLLNFLFLILPPSRFFLFKRICLRLCKVDIGRNASMCGHSWIYGRGKLHIGKDTWLSPGVIIHTHTNADIHIGDCCDIGPNVEFIPGSHRISNASRRAGEGIAKPITVGNGTWIGARSIILGGITIGEGCVIAAGSVVTKNVPKNSLVAGIPARIKRQLPL